ncbi:uncharacterized protein LOC110242123, partial [Exaiptasia diaphana]|uniref:Uncharacterized protein n=1 Tax=Exaiptasia diaphana TaxID=2652724 RepID=A0A913XFR8_EXADI
MLGKEKPRKRKKHPMTEDELLELCSEMSKDVDEEEDSDSSGDPDDVQSSSSESELELDFVGSYKPKLAIQHRGTNLRKTIAFTYLGLVMLNEPIFLSDLLRKPNAKEMKQGSKLYTGSRGLMFSNNSEEGKHQTSGTR